MACESFVNKVSKKAAQIGAGIYQLASKRSFYAGVTVGVVGTGGVALLANKLRHAPVPTALLANTSSQPIFVNYQPRPQRKGAAVLSEQKPGSRANPIQLPPEAIAAAQARPGSRANPLQLPPEAIAAAQAQPGSRANPLQLPPEAIAAAESTQGGRANVKPVPILSPRPPETKLQAATLRVQASDKTYTPKTSYRVVNLEGKDIGLAITPAIHEDNEGELTALEDAWCVTHTHTGQLISGPYETVSEAHRLASRLSNIPWSAPHLSPKDMMSAQEIIKEYTEQIAPAKQTRTDELSREGGKDEL
ncbi:MAG: hypothetical protein BroJett011_59590 [Chloroflexota bacterium]|nr:MAG: hypothetical protein BroJett011_59590 [Chloroflexota bacterium]